MGAQDHVEKALRELHVLMSQCEVYDREKNLVIVDKKKMIAALQDLSQGVYEVMDEHEFTKNSREQAERDLKKRTEEIVLDANKKAEDVYAASVLYADETLKRVQYIMQDAAASVREIYQKMDTQLQKEKQHVQHNQSELRGTLQSLRDTDKYLQIMEERNKKMDRQRAEEKDEMPAPVTAAPKPEIRINETYFREHGLSFEEEEEIPEEKTEKVTAEVNINLDSEYFKWKEREDSREDGKNGTKSGKKSLFGKIIK